MADINISQNTIQVSQFNMSLNFSFQSLVESKTISTQPLTQTSAQSGNNSLINAAANNDSSEISITARSLSFLRSTVMTSLSKNNTESEITKRLEAATAKFEKNIENRLSRLSNNPKLVAELKSLYTLLDALSDGQSKFKEEFEKFWNDFFGDIETLSGSTPVISTDSLPVQSNSNTKSELSQTSALELNANFEFNFELKIESNRVVLSQKRLTDPLVIDLDGNGADLTNAESGVKFDIDGDGRLDQTAVTTGNDGLLALDKNHNGRIDNGKELFGDQNGAKNGFSELARYDENNDGKIDENDSVYKDLKVVKLKKKKDGSTAQEISSLKDLGIIMISLSKIKNVNEIINGNILTHKSSVNGLLGKNYGIYEANFANYTL